MTQPIPDATLTASLAGDFTNHRVEVNGVELHYVEGGQGEPLLLLPGWPQTWWQFHKIMPALAERYRVIAVDLRGMGSSAKPAGGYDKKTMAQDVYELIRHLGLERVNIAGHDIGAMVAYSLTVHHPELVEKICLLEVHHPDKTFSKLTLLPMPDQHVGGDFTAGSRIYLWWFAFNQVRGLPEKLIAGRERDWIDALFDYMLVDPKSVDDHDRDVYARAYASAEAMRAGNSWYQAYMQDVEDEKDYEPITKPLLALAGDRGNYAFLDYIVPKKATDARVVEVKESGHYFPDEQPEFVIRQLIEFFG